MHDRQTGIFSSITAARAFGAVVFLISLVPAMILLPQIMHTWVNVPFADDWMTPGRQLVSLANGTFSLGDLFSQHNESRPLFPKLVFLVLAWFGGWDVRKDMGATFAMACLDSYLLYRLVRGAAGISRWQAILLLVPMNFVLFWPNAETWTFANTFMMAWPPAMLLCALNVNLSGVSFPKKVLVNSWIAIIATYSWSNGMLLWLLAAPLPAAMFSLRWFPGEQDKAEAKWYLLYALAGILCMVSFFHGYSHGTLSWHLSYWLDYFFVWLGALSGEIQSARILGRCVLGGYALLLFGYFHFARKERDCSDGYPWLVLGAYAILSGMLTSMGRCKLGVEQAISSRYLTVSGYLYIALMGLGFLVWRSVWKQLPPGKAAFPGFAGGVVVGLLASFVIKSHNRGFVQLVAAGEYRKTVLVAWQWSKVIPNDAGLKLVCPWDPDMPRTFGAILERSHVLQIPRWSSEVMAHWSYAEKADGTGNGVLDTCQLTPDGRLAVAGWSRLAARNCPGDYVVLTFCEAGGRPQPCLVLPTDAMRPDVALAFKSAGMLRSGFNQSVIPVDALPKGSVTIEAWAVDLQQSKIRPLHHPFVLETGSFSRR